MKIVYPAISALCLNICCLEAVEPAHNAAHIGMSYAIVHGSGVVCNLFSKPKFVSGSAQPSLQNVNAPDSKVGCMFVGIGSAVIAGIAKESMDKAKNNHKAGFIADGIGIALGTIAIQFSW